MQCGAVTKGRSSGIKYSLMLQDPKGKEFMELTTRTRRHGEASLTTGIHIGRPGFVAYEYRSPAGRLEDFLREVERILTERAVL